MSALIFLDIVAYAGAATGVVLLAGMGCILMRSRTAGRCLGAFIGEGQARKCVADGSFRAATARALGTLFLFFAALIAVCIVRSMQHA